MKRTGFKQKTTVPMKRSRIKVKGHSEVSDIKQEIQDTLRAIVIIRDKRCILYGIKCHHEYGMEGIVFQAEHLIERSNSATYADSRLVVLVCKNCHFWKHVTKSNHDQYDEWVRQRLSPERVRLWDECRKDQWKPKRTGSYDWKLALIALKQELKELSTGND